MAVYVDTARIRATVGVVDGVWSHMMADSIAELVEFAERLGLRPDWLQVKPSGVHFDVVAKVRARAVRAGAIEIKCGSPEWFAVVATARAQFTDPGFVGEPVPPPGGLF